MLLIFLPFIWSFQEKLGIITTRLISRLIYQQLFLIGCYDGQLPSNSSGVAVFFFSKCKMVVGVAGLWYAYWGKINPDEVSKVKGVWC